MAQPTPDPQPQPTPQPEPGAQPSGEPSEEQKAKRLAQEVKDLKAQLAAANQQLSDLGTKLDKALTEEDVAKAVKEAKDEAEKAQAAATAEATAREKRLIIENELIKANCIDTTGAMAHINLDDVEVAKDGHISGLDIAKLAESNAHLFQDPNTKGISSAGNPGGSGKKLTKKEIMDIKDPAECKAAIFENLDVFE